MRSGRCVLCGRVAPPGSEDHVFPAERIRVGLPRACCIKCAPKPAPDATAPPWATSLHGPLSALVRCVPQRDVGHMRAIDQSNQTNCPPACGLACASQCHRGSLNGYKVAVETDLPLQALGAIPRVTRAEMAYLGRRTCGILAVADSLNIPSTRRTSYESGDA